MHRSLVNSIVISATVLACGWAYGYTAAVPLTSQQAPGEQFESRSSAEAPSISLEALNWSRHSRATRPANETPKVVSGKEYVVQLKNASSGSTDNVLPNALIQKIVSILGKRPTSPNVGPGAGLPSPPSLSSGDPNKQLFGGKLPPFIERIVQRIQNYFSVYNPPEYFEGNRPPPSSGTQQRPGITLICSNSGTTTDAPESVSCNEMNSSEQQEEQLEQEQEGETLEVCEGGTPSVTEASGGDIASQAESQDEYNVVVTHTVVQDSSLNVYAPPPVSDSAQVEMVSNVVVILEPVAGQYSSPPLDNPNKDKFYVYVNPTANNKNQLQNQLQQPYPQRLKTFEQSVNEDPAEDRDVAAADTSETSRPFANTTFTVIIRGDKLQQYNSANITDSSSLPEIAIYIRNSTKKLKKCRLPSAASVSSDTNGQTETEDCEKDANTYLTSRSVNLDVVVNATESNDVEAKTKTGNDAKNSNSVPNINLALVPPSDLQKIKNKPCASKNKVSLNKNPQLEYYVLKPDTGKMTAKTDVEEMEKATATTYYLQKTDIDGAHLPQTYLPPVSAPIPASSEVVQKQQDDKSTLSLDLLADKKQ